MLIKATEYNTYETKDHVYRCGCDDNGNWLPVKDVDKYTTDKGSANTVNFTPVKTTGLKLEVVLPDDNSAGIYEWSVR